MTVRRVLSLALYALVVGVGVLAGWASLHSWADRALTQLVFSCVVVANVYGQRRVSNRSGPGTAASRPLDGPDDPSHARRRATVLGTDQQP